MTTLLQLPLADETNATDLLLLEQQQSTTAVTLQTLLAGTQPKLTLASGTLLGRVSIFPGLPEPVGVGVGLAMQSGTLTIDETLVAPLNSPALLGDPTAPTPAQGDSSDAIATTAFVQNHVQPLTIIGDAVGSGAGTITLTMPTVTAAGTFNKVTVNAKGLVTGGAALGAADVTSALGFTPASASALQAFAPLASPALTGVPTAPTRPASDNSNAIATTAFVQAHGGGVTAAGDVTGVTSGGTLDLTLPAITSAGTYSKVTVNAKGQVTNGGTLAASDVSGALGFAPVSANALATFPVLAYGAYFDGVHDDAPGINAAIAAANAAGGGVVLLPPGRGRLGSTIVQPYNNVHLIGAGIGLLNYQSLPGYQVTTALTWVGPAGGTMAIVGPQQSATPPYHGTRIGNVDVRGILFDCASLAAIGLQLQSVTFSRFEVAYVEPNQCGLLVTTVWLNEQTSATLGVTEINDTQHNQFETVAGLVTRSWVNTTVASTVTGGGTVVPVANAAGFVTGMRVLIGKNYYIVLSTSGNTIQLTTSVTQSDASAGNNVNFAPRGTYCTALNVVPSGYAGIGAATFPQIWAGNTSVNQFRNVYFLHYAAGGTGFGFGYSDHNRIEKIIGYTLSNFPAVGIEFEGSNSWSGSGSVANHVEYCSTSFACRGTTSFTNPSTTTCIESFDSLNIVLQPVIEAGATIFWGNDVGVEYTRKVVNLTAYDASWEPVTGTWSPEPTTSLAVVNNSADHMHLAGGTGGSDWGLRIDGSGNFHITPVANAGSIALDGPAVSVTALNAGGAIQASGLTLENFVIGSPIKVNGYPGFPRNIEWDSSGSERWLLGADNSAESGSNAGSNLVLSGWSDTGGWLGNYLTVQRASGAVTLTGSLSVGGALTAGGALSAPSLSVSGSLSAGGAIQSTGLTIANFTEGSPIKLSGYPGFLKVIEWDTTGSMRWQLGVDNSAESGGNAGANFLLSGWSDTGGWLGNYLTVRRATGAVGITGAVAIAGATTVPTPSAGDNSNNVATTAWVTNKAYLPQVATVAALRTVSTTGLPDGTAIVLDAYAVRGDGGAGLFVWNTTSSAADNAGVVIAPTGSSGVGRWIRQLADGRLTPQMFGAKGDGVTDDTAAFAAALAAGPVVVPSATYVVSNVIVPNGAWMEGGAGLGYSGDIGAGTPGAGQKAAVVSPILLAKSGTTSCILNVNGCNDLTLKGLFLDGVTTSCDGISSGSTQLMMERVTVVRCVNGLGATSTSGYSGLTDLYTHVATLINCEFANCTNGIANLIDSAMLGGAVSANVVGVNLGSGANANSFVAARFEWNSQDGVQGYNCASNTFTGGLFDRNTWRAVNLGTGCYDFTFTGVQFARNGVANVYPNNSHIALNGTTSVFFNGCVSRTGTNDNGTGTLSPAYFVNYINTNALVTITGCDVSGYTTGFSFGTNPTAYVQRDNDGGGDSFVNAARPYVGSGVAAQTLITKSAANIAPGQTTTIAIGQSPLTNNYSVTARELIVTATNFNSPYQSCAARFNLSFYRDTAVHAPNASAAYGEAGGTGLITWGGSGKLQLSATSVASDGSSWTLTVLNGGSGDGSNWGIWAELR